MQDRMDDRIEAVLADYQQRESDERQMIGTLPEGEMPRRRDEFLLAVGREVGGLLNVLAKGAQARTILEIGTSYGYSTIWLAEAARQTGGRLITLELQEEKAAYARQMLTRAGLIDCVEFRIGDARASIDALPGPFDFVLLDLWKELYVSCFDLVYPKLAPGGFIAADNMIHPPSSKAHADAYREHIRRREGIETVLLPIGHGVELSRRAC